jgi:phi13 family phage major tail protein
MPKIGLKYPVAAKLNETSTPNTYSSGMIIGEAITAGISVELARALLYADDKASESVAEFSSGTLTLNTNDLEYSVQSMLLGHTVTTDEDGTEHLTANTADAAANVGVGFYGRVIRKGVYKFRAIWLYKVKFGEPNDDNNTKGESIEFGTPEIEGTVTANSIGNWKEEILATTETKAIEWLNAKAGILTISITTQPVAKTTVTAGNITGNLSVVAELSGQGSLRYQWYKNDEASFEEATPVDGATSASMTIPTDLTEGDYFYYCIVSASNAAAVTSSMAQVVVEAAEAAGA